MMNRRVLGLLAFGAALAAAPSITGQEPRAASLARWWSPGDGRILASTAAYDNRFGTLSILNTAGQVETRGHAFFEPIGRNGRACVTCHQPADGMSVSVDTIEARWRETNGRDPIFAALDGSNCPSLPQDDAASHSLLLKRGLFRIPLPWPPRRADGTPVEPEFTIEVVRDPTGCNTHPEYGLTSSSPTVSVYRRPRPVANLKYVVADDFGVGPFIAKNGQPAARDPQSGKPLQMNMMADARETTLPGQAVSAALGHLQMASAPSAAQLQQIVAFERQVYAAQSHHREAGDLTEPGGPPALGPAALAAGRAAVLGNNTTNFVFPMGEVWKALPRSGDGAVDVRHLPRHAHDGDGYGQRLDGHRHHQSAVGERTTAKPVVDRQARNAALQADLPHRARAAPVPRPRHLHPGPRSSARLRQVQRHRHDRGAAVPGAGRASALLCQWLGPDAPGAG